MNHERSIVIRLIAIILVLFVVGVIGVMCVGCAPAESSAESSKMSKYAILRLPDDTIVEGYVDRMYTYTSGRTDITIDGVEYSTHWANIVVFYK